MSKQEFYSRGEQGQIWATWLWSVLTILLNLKFLCLQRVQFFI